MSQTSPSNSSGPEVSPRHPRGIDELWRRALGRQLRELRIARDERLEDTAARAGISSQYLSEIERGRKDASSEMIGAVVGALESTLAEVLVLVADSLGGRVGQVADIRSSTRISADQHRHPAPDQPDAQRSPGVRLSLAA